MMGSTGMVDRPLIRPPVQRMPVKFVNAVGSAVGRLGIKRGRWDLASMCRAAERGTGLDDFGDDSFREPLEVLLDSIQREAHLHTVGWHLMLRQIIRRLSIRLEMQAYWKRYPETLENVIARPLFIVGLPRTGTTFLFNLLAQDPAHRWLSNWEALSPLPPRKPGPDDRRCRATRANRMLNWLVPDMRRKHAFAADNPSECFHLLLTTFESEIMPFIIDLPTYQTWLYSRNRLAGYRFYRNQLHVLQHQRWGKRWLLKTPFHIFNLDVLLTVFPDACIIQTHRDPLKALPSTCSLQASFRDLYAETIDCSGLGKQTLEHFAYGLDRCLEVRAKVHADHFWDVDYLTLLRNPVAVVGDIYRHFGFPLTDEVIVKMRAHLANNPQDKHGTHRYSLEEFGLAAETITKRFKQYTQQFRIPSESISS
jgi:hypothetical protein